MSCCENSNCFEPEMTIYHGSNCNCYAHEEHHIECECCCCCPYTPMSSCNICEQQMKYVLEQLIELYPGKVFEFKLINGANAIGIPQKIITGLDKGIIKLGCTESDGIYKGIFNQFVSICKIASFKILLATYNPCINYLPGPFMPNCCGCQTSIEKIIDVGEYADIWVRGCALWPGCVKASEYGIIAMQKLLCVEFVSTCAIEKFMLFDVMPAEAEQQPQ